MPCFNFKLSWGILHVISLYKELTVYTGVSYMVSNNKTGKNYTSNVVEVQKIQMKEVFFVLCNYNCIL